MRRGKLALLLALSPGCDSELSFGRLLDAQVVPFDAHVTLDAHVAPVDAGKSLPGFSCSARGPLFDLTDTIGGACGSESLGAHYALCSCSGLIAGDSTQVDGFDSRLAPYVAGQASGTLAANGELDPYALQTGGSLIVAGSGGVPLMGDLVIGGNLLDQGPLLGAHSVTVGGNARIAGDVRLDRFQVAASCSVAPGSALEVASGAPSATREPVAIAAPCRCDGALDLASILDRARVDNDNVALGLDANNALRAIDAPLERSLPCGRYYVRDISAQRPITLHVTGRVALLVQNRIWIDTAASLTIDLADGAELDLFVGQDISASGLVSIGAASAPSRTRIFFGTSDTLSFAATTTVAATLYAPHAELVTSGTFELFGAALVRRSAAAASLRLHYDRALSRDSCASASCRSNADCSPLLRCDHGACLP